ADFDLSLTGFDPGDIDGLWANLDEERGKCRSASSREPFGPRRRIAADQRMTLRYARRFFTIQ
ncbi:MAG TPA: hypothetical protein VKB88_11480, partial [Bryobacteraceae bacterium]|nr:hypothetical protein [Bryobacteraceae bacterium]